MRRRVSKSAISAAVASALFSVPTWGQTLTAVQTGAANATIKLNLIANMGAGFAPIDAATIPGNNKLYIADVSAGTLTMVSVLDPVAKTVSATPFLSMSGLSVPVTGQGLQGITFSPNYNDPTSPGYHKFYTYEEETSPGASSVMFLHPEVAAPANLGVVREWTANSAGTAIDTSVASRVVFNFGTPAGHMGGGLKFGPDGYLYLSTGDGGGSGDGYSGTINSSTDGFTGRGVSGNGTFVPAISNGQDFTNVLGKVIRIDPYVTNGNGTARATPAGETAKTFNSSTAYFIPNSNPFVGDPQNIYFTNQGPVGSFTPAAPLSEIYATGFRNPWKLSFDKNATAGTGPYVADVGSHGREEIDSLTAGNDYGWPYMEGNIPSPTALTFSGTPRPGGANGPLPFLQKTGSGSLDYSQYASGTLTDPALMAGPTAVLGTRSVTSSLGGIFADHPAVSNGTQNVGANDIYGDGIYGNAYGDINAVTGGFVYRGSAIPQLYGMYVFGGYEFDAADPTKTAYYGYTTAGGRLFYFDPTENATYKTIKEFNYDSTSSLIAQNAGGDLLSVVQADNGDLYGMFANGDIKKLTPHPAWNSTGGGSWSVNSNWSDTAPSGINSTTYFGSTILAPSTVTIDGTRTVGALNFDSTNSYTLSGSTITMDVSGQVGILAGINVDSGNHTVAAPVVLNHDTVFDIDSGTSTLFMTGSLTATGKAVSKQGAGTVQLENLIAGSLTVNQGTAKIRARGTPNSSDGTSRLSALSITSGATLDLTNNALVLDYISPGSLVDTTRQNLLNGRLTSSSADVFHRLGYGDNAVLLKNSFEGQDVSSHTNVLVKYTYAGDTNLDGKVDMTDLQDLASHWNQTSNVWTTGDFNYDGVVNISDLYLLAINWQAGVSNPLGAPSLVDALTSLGLPTNVPEPATASLISLSLFGMLVRRKRN